MKYHIERACRMRFAQPAREHHIQIRLAPWNDESQSLLRLVIEVEPAVELAASYDSFGNLSHHFALLRAHEGVAFSMVAEVETRRDNPFDFQAVPPAREMEWIADSLRQAPRLWDFVLHHGELTPHLPDEIAGLAVPTLQAGVPLLKQIQDSFDWIRQVAEFDPAEEQRGRALRTLFETRRGSSMDLSHLLIALMRHWRIPARFVSGYLDAAYFDADETAAAAEAVRAQAPHHWVEILIPGGGWRGFDPALRLLADATYIRGAIGRDANDIAPIRQSCRGESEAPALDQALVVSRIRA